MYYFVVELQLENLETAFGDRCGCCREPSLITADIFTSLADARAAKDLWEDLEEVRHASVRRIELITVFDSETWPE